MKRRRTRALALTLVLAGGTVAISLAQSPVGQQFQVNSFTTSYQFQPSVSHAANGDFVIVWSSDGSTGSDTDYSIQARRGLANGNPVGPEFQVNTTTVGQQLFPKVAYQPNGNFVVTWASEKSGGSDSSYESIQVQRYLSDGTPDGLEFQANTYTLSYQGSPTVATGADTWFVLAWESLGSSGNDDWDLSIQTRLFKEDGTPLSQQVQVNSYTTSSQRLPDVSIAPDGSFVVVWESSGSDGSDTDDSSIQGQHLASDGSLAGSEFQINTYTTSRQGRPEVAHTPDGGFVVTWESTGADGDTDLRSIQARLYNDAGAPLGDQFQVNTDTAASQDSSAVAVAGDGSFLVVWQSPDGSAQGINAQLFASDGATLGSEFQVNTYTTSKQYEPVVAMTHGGDFVVAWTSYGSTTDDTSYSVQAQRFSSGFFVDGFESGTTSAWSTTVP